MGGVDGARVWGKGGVMGGEKWVYGVLMGVSGVPGEKGEGWRVCVCAGGGPAQGRCPGRDGVSEPVGRETAPETAPWSGPLDHVLEWPRRPPLKPLRAIWN